MTGLYITAFILIALAILLFSPIRLSLSFDGSLSLDARYLFLRFPLYPKEKKIRLSDYTKRKIKKRQKKAMQKRRIAEQKEANKQKKKKRTLTQNLRLLRLLLALLKEIYKDILDAVRIKIRAFRVSVATDDAAKTALLYGTAAQGTAYLLAILQDFTRTEIKHKNVAVTADFLGNQSTIDVHLIFFATPFRLCVLGVKTFYLFLKQKNTSKNKIGVKNDERKQSQ